jgi:peptidoglycan/LPS O-acetylase OafA/YrhL
MIEKNAFDFLRLFFAVSIFFCHLAELSMHEELQFLLSLFSASIAVKAFFVISGFLIAKSYAKSTSLKQYLIKRAKRILPAYVFVVLFSTVVLFLVSNLSAVHYFINPVTFRYVGWNLVFMNFMQPCLPGVFEYNFTCAVNGALWTLKIEEGFYLLIPFLFYLFDKMKNKTVLLIVLYCCSIAYFQLLSNYYQLPVLAKQLPGYLSYFSVGMLLYFNFQTVQKFNKPLLVGAILVFIIMLYQYNAYLFPLSLGLLVILLAYNLPFLNNFGKYGDFTYGIYIFHFPIIQVFKHFGLFEQYNPFLVGAMICFVTVGMALFSWFFIEVKFLDRYKNKAIACK